MDDKKVPQKRGFLKNLKSTYEYAKKGKKYLFFFIISSIVMTVISVVVPVIMAKRLVFITNNNLSKLFGVIFIILWIELFRNITRYFASYSYNKFYYDVRKNLQLELTRETLKITQSDLNDNSSGVFIERINNDTDNLTDIFAEMIDYFTAIIGNIGILISVYFINVWVGLAYTVYIIVLFFIHKYTSEINYKNRKLWKKSMEKTGGFISEIVRGSKDIKILDAEESFLNKAEEYIDETNKISYKYQITSKRMRLYSGTANDLGDFAISMIIYFALLSTMLSVENVLIILNYHNQLTWTSNWIEQIFGIIKRFNLAANRIFGILDGDEFEKEKFGRKNLKDFNGNIEFNKVCFSYKKGLPILNELSFKVKGNQTVGFVGPSGAGKSTIFNIISAINKIDSGVVTFDDQDINKLNKSSIRGNLSVISQNAYIFNMSIMDNLKIVKYDSTEEEIKEACKLACLDDFIEGLPDKYNTIVGEGGVTLSGGQKQRLAIARALLLKTKVLLFDEATSALDNETQTKIQNAINNLKGEYTILIIAHRLSTVINADKLIVIDEGKVVGEGKHEKLLKNCSVYKKLYEQEGKENKKEKGIK